MERSLSRKMKPLALLTLILLSAMITLSVLPYARAETTILAMIPVSGNVGTTVQVTANMTTVNGTYQIQFDGVVLAGGSAIGNDINASFVVPETIGGSHNVTIVGPNSENDTRSFTVTSAYSLELTPKVELPAQLQEGDAVTIKAIITGANSSQTQASNVTVQAPNNVTYTQGLDVNITALGSGNASIIYPQGFTSANTSLVGEYQVSFSTTDTTLATASFRIGLTNSTEYHRNQTVPIRALYQPGENVTATITGKNMNIPPANLTADNSTGIVSYSGFSVPSNASIDTYQISIISISPNGTVKNPPDIQNFTVPGYGINVTSRNLALEPAPNVNITVLESGNVVDNQTSDASGLALLKLEPGNYIGEAYFKGVNVGEHWINVTGPALVDFVCNLTNLNVTVTANVNGAEVLIPEAGVYLAQALTPLVPESVTTTDINGSAVVHSLLPNVTYTLNISRYDVVFNTTTLQSLFVNGDVAAWFDVPVTCPQLTLHVNATDAIAQPVKNAVVKVQETLGGIYYENDTNTEGVAIFSSVFGKYQVRVYDQNGIELNVTSVDLFTDGNVSILCQLYELNVSIRVLDYLGQPISNVNVKLERDGLLPRSTRTLGDGKATFNGVTGGTLQITVYLFSETQPTMEDVFWVDNSTTVDIRAEKYVMLAGSLIETGQLATIVIIGAIVVLILSLEVYRRKRVGPKKATS